MMKKNQALILLLIFLLGHANLAAIGRGDPNLKLFGVDNEGSELQDTSNKASTESDRNVVEEAQKVEPNVVEEAQKVEPEQLMMPEKSEFRAENPLPNLGKIGYSYDQILAVEGRPASEKNRDVITYKNRVWEQQICQITYTFTNDQVSNILIDFRKINSTKLFNYFEDRGKLLNRNSSYKLLENSLYYNKTNLSLQEQQNLEDQAEQFKADHQQYFPKTNLGSFLYDNQLLYFKENAKDTNRVKLYIYPYLEK